MKIQTEPPFLRLHNSFHIIHTICQQLLRSHSILQSLREPILQTGVACHKPPEESLTAWGWTRMSVHRVSQQCPECKVSPSSGMEQLVLQPGHWAPHLPTSTCLIGPSRPTQKRPCCSLQTRCKKVRIPYPCCSQLTRKHLVFKQKTTPVTDEGQQWSSLRKECISQHVLLTLWGN